MSWIDEMMSVVTTGFNRRMSRWFVVRKTFDFFDWASPAIVSALVFVRVVKWNDSVDTIKGSRGKVLWEEAVKRGVSMRSIMIFGKPADAYEARKNGRRFLFSSVPSGGGGEQYDALWWMDDKAALKKRLEAVHVPVARGGSFSRWDTLVKRFRELTAPVIIKPRIGSRGRHTTTFIYTEAELKKAFKIARQLGPFVVMEEHLTGSVYRGTVVDGKVAAILRGDPPRVTGDGVHTIAELIELKNSSRDPRISAVVITPYHLDFLSRSGMTLDTVVPNGKTIDLLEKIGISYGGMSAEVTPQAHPKIVEYLTRAAHMIGYPIIGFDFIIGDVTADPDTQRWGIIEANSAPFINLHHDPIQGEPVNVAALVWDMVEARNLAPKKK